MSGELVIRFRAPQSPAEAVPTVVPSGPRSFVLHTDGDTIALPDVVLEQRDAAGYLTAMMPPRIVVRETEGRSISPRLVRALEVAWCPSGNERLNVDGPRVIAADVRIPALLVHGDAAGGAPRDPRDPRAAFAAQPPYQPPPQQPAPLQPPQSYPAFDANADTVVFSATAPTVPFAAVAANGTAELTGPGEPVQVDVSWLVEYLGPFGQETAQGSVTLEFAPPGQSPTFQQVPQEDEFLTLRPPFSGPDFQRFVVVDFGTTASTATLHDGAVVANQVVDPAQSAALGEMLAELTAPPADAPQQWRDELTRLRGDSVALAREGGPRIAWDTALGRLAEPDVADAVMLEVERSCRNGTRALRDWLLPRLHAGYSRVVNTPALGRHHLRPVPYWDGRDGLTHAPASAIVETAETVYEQRLSPYRDHGFRLCGEDAGGLVGIKRALFQYRPRPVPGSDRSAVHLAQHMYHLLVDEAEWSTKEREGGLPSRVRTAVVTYPTTILPEAKARLEQLVREGLSIPDVVMDFDEGLAAGLFFVMRDLSGNQNLGLEALRAGSRPVSDDPPTWQRIMLVIDIGGGTTDIALLGLTLIDTTAELTDEQRFVSGRDYRLEPRLLGSTGHGQLGGDLLTLQVFYWLKARLVDALTAGAESPAGAGGRPPRPLAEQVAEQAAIRLPEIVDPRVRARLADVLPTHDEPGLDEDETELRRHRFRVLWQLAEKKKRELGQDGDRETVLSVEEINTVLGSAGHGQQWQPAALPLDREQFRQLTAPVLHQAAEIGAHLVRTTFERLRRQRIAAQQEGRPLPPEPVLDQVVLSGRTSALAEVRAAVTTQLTKGGHHSIGWNPAALSVETGFVAKQATSIGAAWAQTIRNRAGVAAGFGRRGDAAGVDNGVIRLSDLQIRTHGLFSSLPCDFEVGAQAGQFLPLFQAGESFSELDASGRAGVRSPGWLQLPRELVLYRPVAELTRIQWGSFAIRQAAIEEGFALTGPVWDVDRGAQASYQIEVDDRLYPRILICNGAAHLLVGGVELDLRGRSDGLEFDETLGHGVVPGRLCVALTDPDQGPPRLAEVFPALWAAAEPGFAKPGDTLPQGGGKGLLQYFPESFHDDADSEQPPVPGRTARLRAAPQRGLFHFYLDREDGSAPEHLGRLAAPAQARYGLEDHYTATLDARGRLRVHRGEIPYLPASTLREVELRPGRVLSRPMDEGKSDFNEYWDPFSGGH